MPTTATISDDISDSAGDDSSPINLLPPDALHNILSRLPLRSAISCRPISHLFLSLLSSPPFLSSLPPLRLLSLRHPRHPSPHLLSFDPLLRRWLRLPLDFLPFPDPFPIASSPSLLFLWVPHPPNSKSLLVSNPLSKSFRLLPPLGSAWSRHGTVLAGPHDTVLVLTELAALSYSRALDRWLTFSLNLPSKPRSPILMSGVVYCLCDVGNPWRSQWKLFGCRVAELGQGRSWGAVERSEWGDVFDVLKRPRILAGKGGGRILMIGGLRSSFAVDAPCSTVLILRLNLGSMDWDEAGRMPVEMYRCFGGGMAREVAAAGGAAAGSGNNKVKVFGGDGMVWFSGKRVKGKLAMWEEDEIGKVGGGRWSWVEGVPACTDGMYRGFVFDAGFTAYP